MPRSPTCSAGSWTVVSSGSTAVARARSSKPVTERSSGTRSPSRRAALHAPAARMSSSQTIAVGRSPVTVSACSAASRPARTSSGARTVRTSAPGTASTASCSAWARTANVQVSTADARWTKRRWPRPSRWSVTWRMPSAMSRLTWAAASVPAGSLSSITSGRSAPCRALSASEAIEEAITPSSEARAEAKGSRAGPVPSGEG